MALKEELKIEIVESLEPTKQMPPRPLVIEDFTQLKRGDIIQLHYWTVNKGEMLFRFDRIDIDPEDPQQLRRVCGQIVDTRHIDADKRKIPHEEMRKKLLAQQKEFDNKPIWASVDGYLYEFGGYVCRGSGAEPVHGEMPREVFLDCL